MILATKKLDFSDFKDEAEGKDAADKLVEVFNAANPEQARMNPPRLFEGYWKLDEFFFAVCTGECFLEMGWMGLSATLMRGSPHTHTQSNNETA